MPSLPRRMDAASRGRLATLCMLVPESSTCRDAHHSTLSAYSSRASMIWSSERLSSSALARTCSTIV